MDKHAAALLDAAELCKWPAPTCIELLGQPENKAFEFKAVYRKFLSCLVGESCWLGGTLLEKFWSQVEKCHPQFPENVQELRSTEYSSPDQSIQTLFENIDKQVVDFHPVFELAADLFTHIGLAFMILDDNHIWRFTSPSTNTVSSREDTPNPKIVQNEEELTLLALKRDGTSCPLSDVPYFSLGCIDPTLTHIIPCSVRSKPETLKYIALISGKTIANVVIKRLDTIDNALAVAASIAASHRLNRWGIEARHSVGSRSQSTKVDYLFRSFSPDLECRIGSTLLRDGDQILFGIGPDGGQLHCGPDPVLCDLRLAVGRALYNSGAADFISQLIRDADDTDCPHVVMDGKNFHDILNAKLLISGRAQII